MKRLTFALISSCAISAMSSTAYAQEAEADNGGIQEIIVTA